jgi:hypothetical protein
MYGKKGIAFALLHNLRVKLGVLDISNGLGTGMFVVDKPFLSICVTIS